MGPGGLIEMAPSMILVVADNVEVQQAFASALGPSGLAPVIAFTVQEAVAILSRHPISLIFCSDEMPDEEIDRLIQHTMWPWSYVPVVVVSRDGNWERYLESVRNSTFDYLLYPLSQREISRLLTNVESYRNFSIGHFPTRGVSHSEITQNLLHPRIG